MLACEVPAWWKSIHFNCHTHAHAQKHILSAPAAIHWRYMATRTPESSIPVNFLCHSIIHATPLISPMLVTVVEFHTERICDADTRWFCDCQMTYCISFSLSFPPPQGIWLCCQKLVSKHYSQESSRFRTWHRVTSWAQLWLWVLWLCIIIFVVHHIQQTDTKSISPLLAATHCSFPQ